jgi:predicted site-specific integrase-resolvase
MSRQSAKSTFFSLKQVLDRVKVSRATLYKWMAEGLIKVPLKNGSGRLFWNREQLRDLATFVKERYTPRPME